MATFTVEEFNYPTASTDDVAQIRAVYEHAFSVDIGLQFDAALDADFTQPLAYYAADVRGAYFVVRQMNAESSSSDATHIRKAAGDAESTLHDSSSSCGNYKSKGIIVGTAGIRAIRVVETCADFADTARASNDDDVGSADSRICELKRMFILTVGRGKGLASAMLRLILAKAKGLGFAVMVLDTCQKLVAANALYEKAGFAECSNYNGNPRADRFMALKLT